jgi:hypothetical protein
MAKIYIGKDGRVICYSEICSCIEDCKRFNECLEVRSFFEVLDDITKLGESLVSIENNMIDNKCFMCPQFSEQFNKIHGIKIKIDEILDKET